MNIRQISVLFVFFICLFSVTGLLPAKAAYIICDPGVWECCTTTSHKQCNSTGTGYYACSACTYGCNSLTGGCKSAPAPTATPRPAPTSTPVPPAPTPYCSGFCNDTYCPAGYGQVSGCGMGFICCKAYPPTSTPAPLPSATPTPSCKSNTSLCFNNSECCSRKCAADDVSLNYYCDLSCGGNFESCCYPNSCNSGLICNSTNHYCYAPPTPTPTPLPKICSSLSYHCLSLSTANPAALINRCSADQTQWQFAYNCPTGQICNSTADNCTTSVTASVTPTPICTNGAVACSGTLKYVCFQGNWELTTDTSYCVKPTPISSSTYDCPLVNGVADCTQTNPLWTNDPFPVCSDPSSNKIYLKGCGPSTTCSLLCSCKKTPEFCNLRNCIQTISEFKNSLTCSGTALSWHTEILKRYPECFSVSTEKPDVNVNLVTGETLPSGIFSWTKIDQMLTVGKVQIAGYFTLKTPDKNYIIEHISLIAGRDPVTDERLYNDPFFNSENTDPKYQISSSYLERYLSIEIYAANIVY